MTEDAITVMIHRKDGRLLVTPWALSNIGFQCLDDLFVAEPGHDGLVHAFELAVERARAASKLSRDQRFGERGQPYWKRAGFGSEKELVKGASAITVLMSAKRTELRHLVPMKDDGGMEAKSPPKTLKPGIPVDQIAREVLVLFDEGV